MNSGSTKPRVSVIITAYNSASLISETLQSVYRQTYQNIEVIVADDGSTDNTKALIEEKFPETKYYWKPNGGQPSARNLGISHATGELIAFVDSDDVWEPEKISRQVDEFRKAPDLMWCYCDCLEFEGAPSNVTGRFSSMSQPHDGEILETLFIHNFITSPTIMLRRSVIEEIGTWDEKVQRAEDWNMWLRIAAHFPIKYISEPLAFYRRHADNKRSKISLDQYLESHLQVYNNVLSANRERLYHLRHRALSNIYYKLGLSAIKACNRRKAISYLMIAIRHQPFRIRLYAFLLSLLLPERFITFLIELRTDRRKRTAHRSGKIAP
jgi:glycosyltransferase involved in cell wall biosynthesis